MTAEIAILNSSAVAIAADSAVTIGLGKKIYNSAIKVFSLSKLSPVGVMIYGNAGLLDVPWETIIKVYRAELQHRTFPTLEDYASDFLSFLPKQNRFFPKDRQANWTTGNIVGYFLAIRNHVMNDVERHLREQGGIDDAITINLLKQTITGHHDRLTKLPFITGLSSQWETSFKRRLRPTLEKLIAEVFQKLPVDSQDSSQLLDIAVWVHSREIVSDGHSGIVICGFGNDDVYPALVTNLVDGVFEGKLKVKHSIDKSFRIKNGSDCSIIPFAQDDMVASFMEGLNPSVNTFTQRWLRDVFARLPELIPNSVLCGDDTERSTSRETFAKAANDLLEKFFEQLTAFKKQEHVEPILSMVRVLPKDELAAMAESLVSLTAFKRRMTDELETVGGPVDVAVISKGDGLIWVKRKHYFDPTLNQHFFANYFRGVTNGTA